MSLFSRRIRSKTPKSLETDIHSHLLPGLDDGVSDFEESVQIIIGFQSLGYTKLIVTPHIMWDYYPNSPQNIRAKAEELRQVLKDRNIKMVIECAAEYYLDEQFMSLVKSDDEILSFGEGFVLFETSFVNQPAYLFDAIFRINARGLKPVLAHPERYLYLQHNPELITEISERGVYFQLNLNSLSGYYSPGARKMSKKLITNGLVHFLGSDCHHPSQLVALKKSIQNKLYERTLGLDLLNNSL